MAPPPPRRPQLARLSASFAQCGGEVKGYGECIARNAEKIERHACDREYRLLSSCLRRAWREAARKV